MPPIEENLSLDIRQALNKVKQLDQALAAALKKSINVTTTGATKGVAASIRGELQGLATAQGKAAGGANALTGAQNRAANATRGLNAEITRVGRNNGLEQLGAGARRLGDVLTAAIALPFIGATKAVNSYSIGFSEAIRRSSDLANLAAKDVGRVEEALLDLAPAVAKGPKELAEAFYFISSSGAITDTAEQLKTLEISGQAAALGLGETQNIANLLTQTMASFPDAFGNLEGPQKAIEVLLQTVREGKAEPDQLVGALARVVPIAKTLGVSFQDSSAALAVLSSTTKDATQAGTFLLNFFSKVARPSEGAKKALIEQSIAADGTAFSFDQLQQTIRSKGLLSGLQQLKGELGGNEEALTNIFPEIRATQGAIQLFTADNERLVGVFQRVNKGATDFGDAFARLRNTDAFKQKQAIAELQVAMVKFGATVVPVVTKVLGFVSGLATGFSNLPDPIQDATFALLALTAGGGIFLSAAGRIIQSVGLIANGLAKLAVVGGGGSFVGGLGLVAGIRSLGDARAAVSLLTSQMGLLGKATIVAGTAALVFKAYKDVTGYLNRSSIAADQLKDDIGDLSAVVLTNAESLNVQEVAFSKTSEIVERYGDAIAKATGTQLNTKLIDRNQVDDLGRLGLTADGVAASLSNVATGQKALDDIIELAIQRGEIRIAQDQATTEGQEKRNLSIQEQIDLFRKTDNINKLQIKDNRGLIETLYEIRQVSVQSTKDQLALALGGNALAASAIKASSAYSLLNEQQRKGVDATLEVAAAQEKANQAALDSKPALSEAEKAANGLADEMSNAAGSINDLGTALDELLGRSQNAVQLQLGFRSALKDIAEAAKETKRDITNEKFADALFAGFKNAADTAQNQLAQGLSGDQITANYRKAFDQIRKESGLTAQKFDELLTFFQVPKDVHIEPVLDEEGVQKGEQIIGDLTSTREVLINPNLPLEERRAIAEYFAAVQSDKAVPVIPIVFPAEKEAIETYLTSLERERKLKVGVIFEIEKLAPGITVVTDTATGRSEIRGPGGTIFKREGGFVNRGVGGLVSYAHGAMQPHIAREQRIKYAEPGTDGEAFIPLARDGRRTRAVGITRKVAQRFGYEIVPRRNLMHAAQGAFTGAGQSGFGSSNSEVVGTLVDGFNALSGKLDRLTSSVREIEGGVNVPVTAIASDNPDAVGQRIGMAIKETMRSR